LRYLHICLQYVLIRFIPSIILPNLHSPPFLEQFQQVSLFSCSIFTHICKVHPPSSICCLPFPVPQIPTHTELFYLPVFQFFRCILIVRGSFTLVFFTCIYCTLFRLLALSLSSCSLIIQQLSVHFIYYLHT
jgi:hypothetical protein